MSENNVELARELYAAFGRGDIAQVLAAFDERIEWREAEGNPYQMDGSAWIGTEAIVSNLLQKLATEWDGFTVTPATFTATADGVLTQGRYTGTYKPSGQSIDAQFAHVWTIRDGKIVAFQQYMNTAQMQAVMKGSTTRTAVAGGH
jgi:ketosteroid isomerase-like protein